MLELSRIDNRVRVQLPLSEGATGLRDIATELNNALGAIVNIKVKTILIDCSDDTDNHISVTYAKKVDSADGTVLGEWKHTHYQLKDEPAIVEYDINPETGEEIEGTREVIKAENLHLTDWDASPIADAIVGSVLNHINEIEG